MKPGSVAGVEVIPKQQLKSQYGIFFLSWILGCFMTQILKAVTWKVFTDSVDHTAAEGQFSFPRCLLMAV